MMKRTLTLFAGLWSMTLSLTAQQAHFSKEYKQLNYGKAAVLVPEVHELANILAAISTIGREDKNMVNTNSKYYKEVLDHFLPFKDHPVMSVINANLTEVFGESTYNYYYNIRMNSCAYEFNGRKIINGGVYERMSFDENDHFKEQLKKIEDFAEQSGFRKFYAAHIPYYDSLIKVYHKLCPVDKMWKWVEGQFPQRYQGYKVIFSPLIGGAHATQNFKDDAYSETVMFISGPLFRNPAALTQEEKEAVLSRVVFTEIDHNYVNPTTELFNSGIMAAMSKVDCWNTKVQRYDHPVSTFNEYMTWAVFSLYLKDHFSAAVFEKRNEAEAEFMATRRGFKKFKEFNAELLELYLHRKENVRVYDLHSPMVRWANAQNCH